MDYISNLKKDFLPAILDTSRKTFLPISIVYIIFTILTLLIFIPLFTQVLQFDMEFLEKIITRSPLDRQVLFEEHFKFLGDDGLGIKASISFLVASILLIIMSTWFYNFCLLLIDNYTKTHAVNTSNVLADTFKTNLMKLIQTNFLQIGIFFTLYVIILLLLVSMAQINVFLVGIMGLVLGLLFFVVLVRFLLVNTTALFTDKTIYESFSYSFEKIDFRTAFKYLAICIVSIIVYIIFAVVLMSIQTFLFQAGTIGIVLYVILQIMVSGFMIALMCSALVGLYYLHKDEEVLED